MQVIYRKHVKAGRLLNSGKPVIVTRDIPLSIHYEAESIKDKHPLSAEPYELGADIEGIIYIKGEPCDLSTLRLIIEEV